MNVDQSSFADRLLADALAADLRRPLAFVERQTTARWDHVESSVLERAALYRHELSATEALSDRALGSARDRWTKLTHGEEEPQVVDVLSRAARGMLQMDGPEMILCVDRKEPGREILRWRFVSLSLPPSILIAAATPSFAPPPAAVRLLHASMAPDGPVAEQHVHHAAMTSFEEVWAMICLRAVLRPSDFLRDLRTERAICPGLHPGECPGKKDPAGKPRTMQEKVAHARHMRGWASILWQAVVARRVLDRHSGHRGPLHTCDAPTCKTGRAILRPFFAGQAALRQGGMASYPWDEERYTLAHRYREATAPIRTGRQIPRDLLPDLAAEERSILTRAFEHLRTDEARAVRTDDADTPTYEALLLQYLRVKTAVYRMLVHPPGEHGLPNFVEHFDQIKVYAPEEARPRRTDPTEPGLSVAATERRVSPDAWPQPCERKDSERTDRSGLADAERREHAWLVHFQRKKPASSFPLYGAAVRQLEIDARGLIRALEADPKRLKTLRGVDVAGVEVDQPLWVAAEALRLVRSRSTEVASRRPRLGLQPLRMTLHAGEDFSWLTSGVRAVAEPFRWNLIERGDRIGHGIAITFDPQDWWKRNQGRVREVKTFDRLLDLAFLAAYTKLERCVDQNAWLEARIKSAVDDLDFGGKKGEGLPQGIDLVRTAMDLWDALGGRTTPRLMRRLLSSRTPPGTDAPLHERWIYSYLWHRGTQRRASAPIRMRVDDDQGDLQIASRRTERDLLITARRRLIQEVARWQVCIESNPSSNLIVGGLDAMGAAQDFLQQRSTQHGNWTLPWTISTDDPVTFATTLADEYAYAWAGMVLRADNPYDPSYARALLEEAAATLMRTRFTLPIYEDERLGRSRSRRS